MNEDDIAQFYHSLDRALFLDGGQQRFAYENRPLPIGYGQTISQPSLVLEMTLALAPDETCRVLEIGTGSGYQTALLARFASEVYTVERIGALQKSAKQRLDAMGFENIRYRISDGSEGWAAHAPYERIITTAAAGEMPAALIDQLAPGGIAIMPVGPAACQDLLKVRKTSDGSLEKQTLCRVRFVELVGRYGWSGRNSH